jgi:hypothetical protein
VIDQPPVVAFVPSPGAGGVVGRIKVAEDNNPLPRDRVIFDYDHFSGVPLTGASWNVDRFAFGIEKTFFDQRFSIELRLPFASTLNSDFVSGAESSNTELGDLRIALKALLYRCEAFNLAAGLGIHVPTADDIRVVLPDGTPLAHFSNESVILTPYVAALFTPGERFFAQTWLSFDFDTNGSPVEVNSTLTGLQSVGRLSDTTSMLVDAQVGYWLYIASDPCSLVQRLAPFIELHYLTSLENPEVLQQGGIVVGDTGGHREELNLSAGFVAELGHRVQLSVGAAVPLLGSSDRTFDWQLGVRASVFFGPTARDRSTTSAPSTF